MSPANLDIDTIRKYSRYARAICTFWLAVLAAGICYYLLKKLPGAPTAGAKFWITVAILSSTLGCGFIYLLRRLFENLAGGEIFSSRNVGHFRNMAYIFFATGVFNLLVLFICTTLVMNGAIEPTEPMPGRRQPEDNYLFGMVNSFLMAVILRLAAWIMQVGLRVRNEADELKRDAELVV
jgi:hypothetical protein